MNDTVSSLARENAELRERLAEAESVLQAIRHGEIDAVVVTGPEGDRVFTLEGADHPYRVLVESMNEGAATLTEDGVVLYSNRRLLALLGSAARDLIGSHIHDWATPDCRDQLRALIRAQQAGELTMRTSAGNALPVHVSVSPLASGNAELRCAIVTDLSLARHHAELEAAARQIHEANERLREADQRKDEFLATLAHELRNPLAPIRAAAHVIKLLDPEDGNLVQARDMIERQVGVLARLVDDLLEVSRMTMGRIELRRRTEALSTLLTSIAEAARADMAKAGHAFTVDIGEEPLWLEVDATRLGQAISNVLQNAAKYTPSGGSITLEAAREEDRAVIRIRDNGTGIDPRLLPRIFDMFVQGERNGRRQQSGLGIGLALTRKLIEMHGGTITVASEGIGRGSEFVIRLPLHGRPEPQARTEIAAHEDLPPRHRVLVVDDNRDAAESLRAMLELSGHEAKAVYLGASALTAVPEFRPDLVLLDIGLPDIDGCEVARMLRERHGTACPKLVAISGWGQVEDKRRVAAAGIEEHFTKPVDPTLLDGLLTRCGGTSR